MVGPGKIFEIEVLIWLENAMLNLVVANNKDGLLTVVAPGEG